MRPVTAPATALRHVRIALLVVTASKSPEHIHAVSDLDVQLLIGNLDIQLLNAQSLVAQRVWSASVAMRVSSSFSSTPILFL